ncbi:hypothetical protein ACFS5M_03300 [Lacinutrix iliipiscaria]|uniref:SMODS-associating 2TM beta-strand rich effector domain-containing protein n=1 Tax=Lacinutrix iliipiscaria TaxID=1230532 RepID=A0ABW5WKB0_9FLAO
MDDSNIIIAGAKKPFWQLIIAALCFTAVIAIISSSVLYNYFNLNSFKKIGTLTEVIIYLIGIGIGFSSQKRIYVNLKTSKFRSTREVGPIKVGRWKTIKNYEYVSIFHQPLTNGAYVFEVNLWYNGNKHFELYSENNFKSALEVGYDLSEELNIDLLDATIPNDYKWIDKEALKQNAKAYT